MISLIASHVVPDFCSPEFRAGLWPFEKVAVVPVPEATVNQNDGPVFGEYHVGFTREPFVVKSKAESTAVEGRAQEHLRPGVPAFDAGHHP